LNRKETEKIRKIITRPLFIGRDKNDSNKKKECLRTKMQKEKLSSSLSCRTKTGIER
jgi:hypothetical protein